MPDEDSHRTGKLRRRRLSPGETQNAEAGASFRDGTHTPNVLKFN
jgi:hypothetical protein